MGLREKGACGRLSGSAGWGVGSGRKSGEEDIEEDPPPIHRVIEFPTKEFAADFRVEFVMKKEGQSRYR